MKRFREYLTESAFYPETWRPHDIPIVHLYHQRLPLAEIQSTIQDQYGDISLGEIYRALKRHGVDPNRRQRPYLNDVVYYYDSGLGLDEIARLTGYSSRHVRNILQEKLQNDQQQ